MATAGGCVEVGGALALLVNVDQRKFRNEVEMSPDGGLHVSFYTSPHDARASPILSRLLVSASPLWENLASPHPPKEGEGVFLFCRPPNRAYVFMGRLSLVAAEPHSRGIKAVFALEDAGRLREESTEFVAIVRALAVR